MRITLCGSGRFKNEIFEAEMHLSKLGHTVYSFGDKSVSYHGQGPIANKQMLDLVHLDKICNSDAVGLIKAGVYFGHSTAREMLWGWIQGREFYDVIPRDGMLLSLDPDTVRDQAISRLKEPS